MLSRYLSKAPNTACDHSQKTVYLYPADGARRVLHTTLRVPQPIIGFYSWPLSQRLLAASVQRQSLQRVPEQGGPIQKEVPPDGSRRPPLETDEEAKRESEWREWMRRRSSSGSTRPPIGLCLGVIRGRLPVPTRRSIVINTPHHGFSHSGLHLCLRIDCRTETNACVYLPDISSSVLL